MDAPDLHFPAKGKPPRSPQSPRMRRELQLVREEEFEDVQLNDVSVPPEARQETPDSALEYEPNNNFSAPDSSVDFYATSFGSQTSPNLHYASHSLPVSPLRLKKDWRNSMPAFNRSHSTHSADSINVSRQFSNDKSIKSELSEVSADSGGSKGSRDTNETNGTDGTGLSNPDSFEFTTSPRHSHRSPNTSSVYQNTPISPLRSPLVRNKSPIRLPLSPERTRTPPRLIFDDAESRQSSPRMHRVMPLSMGPYDTETDLTGNDLTEPELLNDEDYESLNINRSPVPRLEYAESMDRDYTTSETLAQIERLRDEFEEANATQGPIYPAPIPQILIRPPLLRKQAPESLDSRHRSRIDLPPRPRWGSSPLEPQLDSEQMESEDDFDSDRATISDDEAEYADALEEEVQEPQKTVKRGWLKKLFKSNRDAEYEDLNELNGAAIHDNDALTSAEQADNMMEFSKLNMDAVQRQAELLGLGALHAVTQSTETPSLIEEIEIRKAARKIQRDVLARDVGRIDMMRENNVSGHPMNETAVPTLLQMQKVANEEYKMRKSWMNEALNNNMSRDSDLGEPGNKLRESTVSSSPRSSMLRPEFENTPTSGSSSISPVRNETLAERRQRLKISKETLSERRQRLKREKLQAEAQSQAPVLV